MRYRERLTQASENQIILADVSASMAEQVGDQRKIDLVRRALGQVLSGQQVIAFGSSSVAVSGHDLPEPSGYTALHLALDHAAALRPRHTLVISDGQPDDKSAALRAARRLSGLIDVLYVGPAEDFEAIAFMRQLAACGGGHVVVHDLRIEQAALQPATARLLALPSGR